MRKLYSKDEAEDKFHPLEENFCSKNNQSIFKLLFSLIYRNFYFDY